MKKKTLQQADIFFYRATLALMMCTPTYSASNIEQNWPNYSFTVKLCPYQATPRIHSDLHVEANYYLVCSQMCSPLKIYLSVDSQESVCPENLGKMPSSTQNGSERSPRSFQGCFPLLQGPSCRKLRQNVFDPIGSNTIASVQAFFSIRWTIVIVFDPT